MAHILQPSTSIDPDILINHVSEEADRLLTRRKHESSSLWKGKHPASQDEAISATHPDGANASERASATTVASWDTGHASASRQRKKTKISKCQGSLANSKTSHQLTKTLPSPRTSQ